MDTLALYWVTRAFLGGMIERGSGAVATIAGAAYLVRVARQTDYSASKFVAFGFTESPRIVPRTIGNDVATLVVFPHYIDTVFFEAVGIERGRQGLIVPRSAIRHASNPHPPGSRFRRRHGLLRHRPDNGSFCRA